jgi:DNA replication protein DnaC
LGNHQTNLENNEIPQDFKEIIGRMMKMAELSREQGSQQPAYNRFSECEICDGTGWIWHDTYNDAGIRTHSWSVKCVCRKHKENLRRMKNSGLGHVIEELTFDTFIAQEEWQKTMKRTGEKYLIQLEHGEESRKPWLYLGGAVGCGKTHIATAICGELLKRGLSIKYMQWLPESRRIKSDINEASLDEALDKYYNADVLYIDDLFKQQRNRGARPQPTDADVKIAFMIINNRYNSRKPTILTSEWFLSDDLMEIDEGTFSRIYERTRGGFLLEINPGPGKNFRTTLPTEGGMT